MYSFPKRSTEEEKAILALAKFLGDYNMQKGSIDERYIPFIFEVAAALYDAGYRKAAPAKE